MPDHEHVGAEFRRFLMRNKVYWLLPLITTAVVLATLTAMATLSPEASPFIYTLF